MLDSNQDYIDIIKKVGEYNLKDTYLWRDKAEFFNKHRYYCKHVEDTADWIKFWNDEEYKILNGVWINGFYLPGYYYFYLNYIKIYHKQKAKYDFPDIYDMDYHTFLCLEHAIFLKKHFGVIKKRQAGFSLKLMIPLIVELWFSIGSPNYLACYEEAQVKKSWAEILEPYRDHLNTHTAWYREFNPSKVLDWRTAKQVITDSGRQLTTGRKNTLKGLVLSKSASKGVGGAAKFIFADEAGVNPSLSKFLGYVKPMISYGNMQTGTIIVSGAVGELKHLEGGLKDIIEEPEAQNFYWVENIWDLDRKGKRVGFFVPESWAYFGEDSYDDSPYYGEPFIDSDGNSFVERAEAFILRKREERKGQSIESYNFEVSQAPLTISECFAYRSEKVFPLDLINPQISRIEDTKDHGTYVELYRDKGGVVKHKLLSKFENSPILVHPITNSTNKKGVIQVWEFPKPDAPYGLYWAGVDIVRDSESLNSQSVNSIHIYKSYHQLGSEYNAEKIVATFKARPKDKMEWYETAIMLQEWYNAEALVENNIGWYIEETLKSNKSHRIAKTPKWLMDITPQSTSVLTKPYGVNMTPKLWEAMIDTLVKYVREVIATTFEDDGTPVRHYGVERIKDIQLLREMINYKPKSEQNSKDNYDAMVSFGLALMHAERNEMVGLIHKDYDNSENNGKLNVKDPVFIKNMRELRKKLNNFNFKRR